MSSVYELHLRSTSLRAPLPPPPHPSGRAARARAGETTGERRIRLLRTVLGESGTHGDLML
jgi:hypothetical protein